MTASVTKQPIEALAAKRAVWRGGWIGRTCADSVRDQMWIPLGVPNARDNSLLNEAWNLRLASSPPTKRAFC